MFAKGLRCFAEPLPQHTHHIMTLSIVIDEIAQHLLERGWWKGTYEGKLISLAREFGNPVPTRLGGPIIDRLTVKDKAHAHKNSQSSRYGKGEFPFHNDAAHHEIVPKYIFLRSLHSSPSPRGTVLLDFFPLFRDDDLEIASRELWIVRTGRRSFLAPMIDHHYLRYDPSIMSPALGIRGKAPSIVRSILATAPIERVLWTRYTTLVIDNHRVLHSREARPVNHSKRENRLLERILVRCYELEI
jgi:hypothetical protein